MIRILIVDDEKIERNGIKFLLKQMNLELEIFEAVNGLKALDILKEEVSKDYNIIVLGCTHFYYLKDETINIAFCSVCDHNVCGCGAE